MRQYSKFRLALLALGIFAVLALTGMNIYSLYALHESTVQASIEKQKRQLDEITVATRSRLHQPIRDLWRIEMDRFRTVLDRGEDKPVEFYEILSRVHEDPLFTNAFFMDARNDVCEESGTIEWYNPDSRRLEFVDFPEPLVCDGISMARTRMRVLAEEYKWNTRVIHDSHRSMTIAMFNPANREIVAYVLLEIDDDYLVNQYLAPEIYSRFGTMEDSGVAVWLDDWAKQTVLASNNPDLVSRERSDFIQRFPNMLEEWLLRIRFLEAPEVAASKASLTRNLILLGGGVLLLLGSLLFMYITAQKERELGMRQAAFLANVTHELKTPLAVMQAAGENLADGRVTTTERLSSYGKHIYEESVRLRRMIEKLLDVAKNEAGQLTLKKIPCRLDELTRMYLDDQQAFLRSRGVELDYKVEENIPHVLIDPASFDTLLGNLVENAIKYSPDEKYLGISIFVKNKNVVVEVKDKGTGIPKKAQALIFDKFYRVEDTLTARTKGHGLGLSIVKNLTERNNGVIRVESEYGKGSVFALEFPVATGENHTSVERTNGSIEKQKKQEEYVV